MKGYATCNAGFMTHEAFGLITRSLEKLNSLLEPPIPDKMGIGDIMIKQLP
jgi:hypothetical protein